ncbi:hypothetical protein D3C75_358620 [compost metagenome]
MRVHDTERCVAILQTFSHHAHRTHIKQLVKGEGFLLHLAPDAVDVFRAAIHFSLHTLFFHRLTQRTNEFVDVMLAVYSTLVQQFGNTFVFIRMQVTEAVIFQFPLELANTEAVGKWCINIGALFCRQYAFIFRRVLHFTKVCDAFGKFDDHAAEIIDHRQQHAANVIDLFSRNGISVGRFQLANSRHVANTMNQRHNLVINAFAHHFFGHDACICQREQQSSA